MNNNCVVVADGARARFFCLEDTPSPETESGPNLTEIKGLINPEKEAKETDLWSDSKSGGNRTNGHGMHAYDDHRGRHEEENDRRFARSIAEAAMQMAKKHKAGGLVLVAQKRTLGYLRNEIDSLRSNGMQVHELAKDLSKLPPLELQEHLAKENLVPKRRGPMFA